VRGHPVAEADILVEIGAGGKGGGRPHLTLGVAYLAGGLLYGLQCLFHVGQAFGVLRWPDLANLAFVAAISAAFLVVLVWAIRRDRRDDRRDDRQERRQDRREYREFRNRFNGDHWRRDWNRRHGSGWWRNDRRFRGYSGFRIGFYFAPGYGYYRVPRSYWGQRYHVGDYLPSIFWRYQLDDWRTYGLGYPPEGARWVLVDNTIYLIDERDGYIIDVIQDAWRW